MTSSLQTFTQALLTPDLSFRTLTAARARTDRNGLPLLMRTTRFAEAEITWRDKQWLLSLPLSNAALAAVERTASLVGRLNTPWLTEYRILPGELRWTGPAGEQRRCDLVLQLLPAGKSFRDAMLSETGERLLGALNALREALHDLDFAHNNLRPGNLRWAGGRFIPIRYHDARFGSPESDDGAFEALRQQILQTDNPMGVSDVESVYDPLSRLTGHIWTSHIFEGLVSVEDEGGYGFVDTDNNVVIPAQYVWAGDFHEGRAEVQTHSGMGLIDRQGSYVIPPEYEIVDYIHTESVVRVRKNGLWAEFDYLGRQLTEFGMNND